jgi:hypothetical protein
MQEYRTALVQFDGNGGHLDSLLDERGQGTVAASLGPPYNGLLNQFGRVD